ncbi:MAG: transketolase [Candidatus Curtissbacteria bacterium]|nr:transketolase [Candidatus Curtissbacteria bacterium]
MKKQSLSAKKRGLRSSSSTAGLKADLKDKSRWVRLEVLNAAAKSGKAHLGGTYSCVELLVALYYGKILRYKTNNLNWENRDRFILSKGHACTALYAIFLDLGIISKEMYSSYGENGGLGGQLETWINGVDFNTGSIGHSVGVAAGIALAAKKNGENYRAYTIIGDSEPFEGSIWESVIFASDYKLNNLVVIIDRNRLMVTDVIDDEGLYKNFKEKMMSFGWNIFEINGHDFGEILGTFGKIELSKKPVVVIANTIKGKGVSFMENNLRWHNAALSEEELRAARKEIIEG